MHRVIKKGTTSKSVLLHARRSHRAEGAGAREAVAGKGAYVREGSLAPVEFRLLPGDVGAYREGGFVEVDPELVPGVFQLGVPDAALAEGADSVALVLHVPSLVIEPIWISLVAYDPQDGNRMGMTAIGPEERIAALRGAFPLLTARELREATARGGAT